MQPHPDVNAAETNHSGMRHGKGHRPYLMLLIGTAAS